MEEMRLVEKDKREDQSQHKAYIYTKVLQHFVIIYS